VSEANLNVIDVEDVSVVFRKGKRSNHSPIRRSITSVFRKTRYEEFWALRHLNFTVREGEVLGVIGKNGAGKTTLLRLLVGVLYPDSGHVKVRGRISSILSLGVGFSIHLSGRDNIYLNGIYLGLTRSQIDNIFDDIVAFAELEDFIDHQVRYYSSGMRARLGFSIAVSVEPDILIIDEVLAAGDKDFKKKAKAKMKDFMARAKAIVIASHNMKLITDMCDSVLWLQKGEIRVQGPAAKVVKAYTQS
jgi:ABC-type polysaccharide/polyol phosphate transport system ATPase subunit